MGRVCCVKGCKSGLKSFSMPKHWSFHAFPINPDQREKWLKVIPLKTDKVKAHSRVCSVHFSWDDFRYVRSDTNSARFKSKAGLLNDRLNLTPGRVPSRYLSGEEDYVVDDNDLSEEAHEQYWKYKVYENGTKDHVSGQDFGLDERIDLKKVKQEAVEDNGEVNGDIKSLLLDGFVQDLNLEKGKNKKKAPGKLSGIEYDFISLSEVYTLFF